MPKNDEKTIKIIYESNEIPVAIENNYTNALKSIMLTFNFTQDDMEKIKILFIDSDGDKIRLKEENFEDAYESEIWEISKKNQIKIKNLKLSNKNNIYINIIINILKN